MSTTNNSAGFTAPRLKFYRGSKTFIARFVAMRTMRSAVFLGLVFGAFVASKAAGYAAAYPTHQSRLALSMSFGNNVGLSALLGSPHYLDSVTGFTVWNTLGVMVIFGAIWAFITATKTFRGEEDAGRSELLLVGQTTQARAAANTLIGLGISLLVLYLVVALTFIGIGQIQTISFDVGPALFFALAAIASAAVFMALGALMSQLIPTRSRAVSAVTLIFAVSFMLRAAADSANINWLLNVTPLGWIEKLQPLHNPQPQWLIPLAGTILILNCLTILFAHARDLGGSVFADHDTARPRTFLLSSVFGAGLRLTRVTHFSWLGILTLASLFFGFLTKPAAQALSDSLQAASAIAHIAHVSTTTGATTFLGIAFFLLMTLIMAYTANAVGRMREDEAEGYLDNLLIQPVSRLKWILGRIALIAGIIVLAGFIAGVGTWAITTRQDLGIAFDTLLQAGANALTPAIFTLGIAIFAFGFIPRFTSLVGYGVIAWSFLIEMVSSGINLDEWLLNTSVFHHIALAPAASPDWHANSIIIGVGIILCCLGIWRFTNRDLQTA